MTTTPATYGGLSSEEWRGKVPIATMNHQEFSQAGRSGMAQALDEIDRLTAERDKLREALAEKDQINP